MITLLRRHVENEVPEAIGKLAWHYARGDMYGVVNFKKANKLYKRAAELGDVVSMTTLGAFLCAGHGCKVDFVKGAQLFRTAAGRGSAEGQFYFGKALMQGDGVPEDVEQARVMFERSAAQGFEPAMEILAGSTSVAQYFAALETVRKHERRDRLRKQRAAVIEIAAFCQRHARRLAAVCVVRRRRAAARAARLSV
jgi:TPR repeat protein